MTRLLIALAALLTVIAPHARADDITASARGVVRIVTIAVVDDDVVGFGQGSGFAVGPNRIVTNAHVVELAARYPGNVVIGIVPSEGDKSYQGRIIAIDTERDLALIEFSGVRLPPLSLYTGALSEGGAVISLGYPRNVDLATARSASDFITPLTPVRSQGVLSGRRSLMGTAMLVHTADIARGHSGGPLLDGCGRVVGVNSALTRGDEGDSSFGFAVSVPELAAFLTEAKQPVMSIDAACVGVDERLAQAREATARAAAAAAQTERDATEQSRMTREQRVEAARSAAALLRENVTGGAALLLVLGALGVGLGGWLDARGKRRTAIRVAAGGGVAMAAAVALFVLRPGFDPASVPAATAAAITTGAVGDGKLVCTLIADESRINVSKAPDVTLDWNAHGCVNGRTQYIEAGGQWQRILVPDEEQTVSVLNFDPLTGRYTNLRYFLSATEMADIRKRRSRVPVKACTTDQAALGALGTEQSALRGVLPAKPHEFFVYRCKAER